eukprot:COSAG02_NODE_2992_length_7601_cov_11.907662_1_plen_348_part_10
MHSSSLEWLSAEAAGRPATPPRWRATGEKITRAPASSPLFDSPSSPSGSVVDRKLREKGAEMVERRGAPVLSDAVLEALRSGYDTRGDMTAGGVRQAPCAGGQPRWRSVCVAAKETRKRFSLSPASALRQQRKYAVPDDQQHQQHPAATVPGQGALCWNAPALEDNGSSRPARVIQAGRRRGMLQRGAETAKLDLGIEDLYEHARQNLANQRATILQLTAARSEHENTEHTQQVAAAARLTPSHTGVNSRRVDDSDDSSTDKSSAVRFLQQVMRRFDDNGDVSSVGSSQQQCEQVEQRSSDQLRNAPVLAAAAVRKSQVAKPSHQRKPIRRTQKASPDEAVAVAGENW